MDAATSTKDSVKTVHSTHKVRPQYFGWGDVTGRVLDTHTKPIFIFVFSF